MTYLKSLRFKLMLLPTVPLVIVALAFIVIAMITANIQVSKNTVVASEVAEQTILETIREWTEVTLSLGKIITDKPSEQFVQAMKEKDTTTVIKLSESVFKESGHYGMTYTDMKGDVVARVQNPEKYGDNITASLAAADALNGEAVAYVYPTLNNGFSIAAGIPVKDNGSQIGALVFIRRLDDKAILDLLKSNTGSEIVLYHENNALMSTIEESGAYEEVINEEDWATLQRGESVVQETGIFDSERNTIRLIPIAGKDGVIVGAIKLIQTPVDSHWISILWLVVFVLFAAVFTPFVSYNVKKIIRPIRALSEQAQILSTGNVSSDIDITRTDELGVLQKSMQDLTNSLRQTSLLMEGIAQGDFSREHTPLSEDDVLGKSIVKMLHGNNSMLQEIQHAAQLVADDSLLIASGAQALAAGSTEQAATVEELTASISEVSDKAEQAARFSEDANNEVQKVGELMRETNDAMNAMATAMTQIKDKSSEISKVIKVIDDIAFSTNILALNAAVEAARAGVHGKGFAVVADEVRALAAKSAEAAKETAVLIEDSYNSINVGADMTERVSQSMDQTASIALESAKRMETVTNVCRQANVAVTEIDKGIKQIAKVVQANTATADQSALSSQEMSKQGSALMGIVKQYNLRDNE